MRWIFPTDTVHTFKNVFPFKRASIHLEKNAHLHYINVAKTTYTSLIPVGEVGPSKQYMNALSDLQEQSQVEVTTLLMALFHKVMQCSAAINGVISDTCG